MRPVVSADKVLPAATNMRLIKALQYHATPEIFTDTRHAFDGRKNFYAPVELAPRGDSRKVCAPLFKRMFSRSDKFSGSSAATGSRFYKIRRVLAATINTEYVVGCAHSINLLIYHPGFSIALFKGNSRTIPRSALH